VNIKILFSLIILLSISLYSQQNREIALTKGGWSGGIAGWLGWENFDLSENLGDATRNAKVEGFNFIFSSRMAALLK